MNEKQLFHKELIKIALPVTLQSLFQSSFSVIDQIMTGQLGSISIAGIGLASKFTSLFSVLVAAISAAAGIMIAQYIGKKDDKEVGRSFFTNLSLTLVLALVFMILCLGFPKRIMGLYTHDEETVAVAAEYLMIYSISYLPLAFHMLLSTFLRCAGTASVPLYTSIVSAVLNTGLNYIMIFGKLGIPAMGAKGAAWASVIAQVMGCFLLYFLFIKGYQKKEWKLSFSLITDRKGWSQYAGIILPILICEFFWSLGENVYAGIYGHIGREATAAMTLTNPVQAMTIGALTGVSQAAGIITGKLLGAGEYEKAYKDARRMMLYGLAGSAVLSAMIALFGGYYVRIFNVEESVRVMAKNLLLVYALISPVKVQNMILGGGIIRSGGKTKYVMAIDLIGTWIFGVPLGMLSAFIWNMPIAAVYFVLSLEECVRFGISLIVFCRKKWMQSLTGQNKQENNI